jgi:hypothetical protein
MVDREAQLHHLDLSQAERVRKLVVRLQRDLDLYSRLEQQVALLEGAEVWRNLGLPTPERPEATADQLLEMQGKTIASMKSAIWSASNTLRDDHQERRRVAATDGPPALVNEEKE